VVEILHVKGTNVCSGLRHSNITIDIASIGPTFQPTHSRFSSLLGSSSLPLRQLLLQLLLLFASLFVRMVVMFCHRLLSNFLRLCNLPFLLLSILQVSEKHQYGGGST
jgi:hypothetical protein